MSDEAEYFAPRENIEDAMKKKGSFRDKLIALRDYVAHELEANRCKTCFNSQLRTGDTASLVLRLKSLLDDIEALPDPEVMEELDALEQLRSRTSASSDSAPPPPRFQSGPGGYQPR